MDSCSKPDRIQKSQASQWEQTKGHVGTVHARMCWLCRAWGRSGTRAMQEARAVGRTHERLLQRSCVSLRKQRTSARVSEALAILTGNDTLSLVFLSIRLAVTFRGGGKEKDQWLGHR